MHNDQNILLEINMVIKYMNSQYIFAMMSSNGDVCILVHRSFKTHNIPLQ